jgi:hypothetical protein
MQDNAIQYVRGMIQYRVMIGDLYVACEGGRGGVVKMMHRV